MADIDIMESIESASLSQKRQTAERASERSGVIFFCIFYENNLRNRLTCGNAHDII